MQAERGPRVLYIVYWGAAEPLGQSLVLPAVKRLAALGARLTLVTFEKPADLRRREQVGRIREALESCGVRWLPLRYHKRPKAPATAFDVAHASARALAAHLRSRFDIIHARTFVGGLIGLAVAPALGAKLIYHNEGFYPDEQVDAGVWAMGSTPHRVAKSLERRMYSRADAIIALSNRAKSSLEELEGVRGRRTPVMVVPSCVDLDLFRPGAARRPESSGELRLVYVGSVGGRYRLDRAGRFVGAARLDGGARLSVLTRMDAGLVGSTLGGAGLPQSAWTVESAEHTEVPGRIAGHDAGLLFLNSGISEHGGSPTKVGEYWAAGLPVVTSPNVSDVDEIIRRERVGVVVDGNTDDAYSRAVKELRALLADDRLRERCRRAAEKYYALDAACERQMSLYRNLLSNTAGATAAARASKMSNF